MAKKEFSEADIRAMIREMLKKDIDRVERLMTRKYEIKAIAKEIAQKEIESALKNIIDKKEVKEMIKKTIVNQYKYLWEKSNFFINQI